MKVCIVGAGSLGTTIGGALALNGNEVHLIGRKKNMDAINETGLILVFPDGTEKVAQVQAHENADGIGSCDLVIVLCKAFDTEALMRESLELVGLDTVVLSLQNGLGSEDLLCDIVGKEHVIGGKTYIGGMTLSPGKTQATIPGKQTLIGELDGSITQRIVEIGDAFNAAGMETVVSDNIMGVIWDKLFINVATGAVCGITGLPYGDMYQMPELVETAEKAVQEAIDVSAAAGVVTSGWTPHEVLELARENLPYDFKPSILQSLEKKRPTEISVINGAVVRYGEKYNIPTPVNEVLAACIKGIERRIKEYDLEA